MDCWKVRNNLQRPRYTLSQTFSVSFKKTEKQINKNIGIMFMASKFYFRQYIANLITELKIEHRHLIINLSHNKVFTLHVL